MAFRVTGTSELIRKLQTLPSNVASTALRSALLEAAEPIRDAIAANAPRGTPEEPNISNVVINEMKDTGDPLKAGVWVGPSQDAYYAYFHEYGTKYMAARPFMRPAFDHEHPASQAILADAIWETLTRALR